MAESPPTGPEASYSSPTWSPDGREIIFMSDRSAGDGRDWDI